MKFLGLRVFTESGYRKRLREEKKIGFQFALAEFCGADEVHYGTPIIARNDITGKVVVLGDNLIIAHNTFTREDDEIMLDIR